MMNLKKKSQWILDLMAAFWIFAFFGKKNAKERLQLKIFVVLTHLRTW